MAVCFLTLAVLPEGWPITAQIAFTGATVFSGLNAVGVSKSAQVISGEFAFVIMSVLQFIASITTLLLPLAVAVFAPNNTRGEVSSMSKIYVCFNFSGPGCSFLQVLC